MEKFLQINKVTESRVVALRKEGKTYFQIMKACELSQRQVQFILEKHKLIRRKNYTNDPMFLDAVAKYKRQGYTNKKVAVILGCCEATVKNAANKRGF